MYNVCILTKTYYIIYNVQLYNMLHKRRGRIVSLCKTNASKTMYACYTIMCSCLIVRSKLCERCMLFQNMLSIYHNIIFTLKSSAKFSK